MKFACRSCRKVLFDQSQIVPHPPQPTLHPSSFKYRRKPEVVSTSTTETSPSPSESAGTSSMIQEDAQQDSCTSYFVEPSQEWMGGVSAQEGKLVCPKCSTRIGSWKWGGIQCSCGVWHTPGFQIPKSRVDEIV